MIKVNEIHPAVSIAMKENEVNEDNRKVDVEVLNRAFESFNQVTQQLQNSYEKLQQRIHELDLELDKKNRELETNLQEKEQVKNYLNIILENLVSGVIVLDTENRITTLNREAETIVGEPGENCLGGYLKDQTFSGLLEGLKERLDQSPSAKPSVEKEYKAPNGEKRNLRVSASTVWNQKAQASGAVFVLQEITELKRLEEEAQRNRRLRAMGEMAAGIAHEIRNPLGSIELCASLLRDDLKGDEDPEKTQLADSICKGVSHMDRVISSLLLFAQSPHPTKQKCDMTALMKELLDFSMQLVSPDEIEIISDFGDEPLWGSGDAELLKQVFLNLIRNAIQSMPEGGELRISINKSSPDGDSQSNPDPRGFIAVSVADAGPGIDKENLLKLFNPFFTTRDKGTGLGLAIAHNIVKAHQGAIDVESEPGEGACFTVKIPCWQEAVHEK